MNNPKQDNEHESLESYPHLKLHVGVGVFLTPEELALAVNSTAILANFDQLGELTIKFRSKDKIEKL